jgi:hypothetical protein
MRLRIVFKKGFEVVYECGAVVSSAIDGLLELVGFGWRFPGWFLRDRGLRSLRGLGLRFVLPGGEGQRSDGYGHEREETSAKR